MGEHESFDDYFDEIAKVQEVKDKKKNFDELYEASEFSISRSLKDGRVWFIEPFVKTMGGVPVYMLPSRGKGDLMNHLSVEFSNRNAGVDYEWRQDGPDRMVLYRRKA